MEEYIPLQKTKRAMYKISDNGTAIIIAKDKRGVPVILRETIE